MVGSTKSTFLALIPKEVNLATFDRFRPISLCNVSYKILAKLLANRIKPLLSKLISPSQGGFVAGRHILDNVILVQETMHSNHQRKEQGMLIKLDMTNAFDQVNLSFLYKVLLTFRFKPAFVNLIKACIDKPWIVSLVNDWTTSYFQASRGIRKVCPISPFFYIIMVNTLSRKLKAERNEGTLSGIWPMIRLEQINHAVFAYDSILLGGASTRIAKEFNWTLQSFYTILGALINKRKSAVYSWNTEQQTTLWIARILDFAGYASWDKIQYLGLPLTLGENKASLWNEAIIKIKTKIVAWGRQWLNYAGKLTLIKSILSSLPIYQASFLLAPKTITDHISQLLRNFLWQGGEGNQKKFHLVSWDKVKRAKL